jgi:hypothetical protein
MDRRFTLTTLLAALLICCFATLAVAADHPYPNPKRMFVTLPQHPQKYNVPSPAGNLTQWNGKFKDLTNHTRTFTMVGTNPGTTNTTSTIPLIVIPVKMVFDANHGNRTFDPNVNKFQGQSVPVTQTILNSPLFQSNVDFNQGGTDLGKTQYIDAFQRGNAWLYVKNHSNYHVVLSTATVLPEQTFNCNFSGCAVGSEFGKIVGLADINRFDNAVQGWLSQFSSQITPNTFPIFLMYDTYMTSGGCCIGGYHSANGSQPGGQTYGVSTVVDQGSNVFSQDTAALSHEIGEWQDDPFIDNIVGCQDNSILEVGDPLVLDDHPYTVSGFTYHLQDLVFVGYFGANKAVSVHSWLSFQNDEGHVCPGQ